MWLLKPGGWTGQETRTGDSSCCLLCCHSQWLRHLSERLESTCASTECLMITSSFCSPIQAQEHFRQDRSNTEKYRSHSQEIWQQSTRASQCIYGPSAITSAEGPAFLSSCFLRVIHKAILSGRQLWFTFGVDQNKDFGHFPPVFSWRPLFLSISLCDF